MICAHMCTSFTPGEPADLVSSVATLPLKLLLSSRRHVLIAQVHPVGHKVLAFSKDRRWQAERILRFPSKHLVSVCFALCQSGIDLSAVPISTISIYKCTSKCFSSATWICCKTSTLNSRAMRWLPFAAHIQYPSCEARRLVRRMHSGEEQWLI